MMPPKPQTMQVQPEISLLIFESGKARRGWHRHVPTFPV